MLADPLLASGLPWGGHCLLSLARTFGIGRLTAAISTPQGHRTMISLQADPDGRTVIGPDDQGPLHAYLLICGLLSPGHRGTWVAWEAVIIEH
ncbi:uncharacterized protein BO80DRAFT_217318 [Aspergillus ibericus CBS 121593]|uniref:Uncharacterized protein n=1 Tax=Aspergillus ibericus CBS 121593 TaxID=1448316 RepID=A0A395GMY0_9EURO|nr:hypothetical protein BO80DRAFT_217318 [Aspergillus ibericus CBS 121593]RAK96686.1 hypothetical protein BO80DRAFT_217318 [Aspergillus ibericus CBS 121593]